MTPLTGGDVLGLEDVDRTCVALVGGKAAHLGELRRVDGVRVPAGFCVTTDAFHRIATTASIEDLLDPLARLDPDDRDSIRSHSAAIRAVLEGAELPDDLSAAIVGSLERLGGHAWAVRSSATAEDLPTASFAGQHDTYLDVVGADAVLEHVRRCWASTFTERAVTYRLRNGVDHRRVRMAVVVQRMLEPRAAGVLFTADPVTGNRKVASVEAILGLGEALVSGHASPDVFAVRGAEVASRAVATPERPVLTDSQLVELAGLGRRIEAHFGCPQDIEWCHDGDGFHIVQSRPITTLFPVPERDGSENRVYVSVGHQQMMTEAMKPLGLSFWQLTAGRPMYHAGGRLFVDVTDGLASAATRAGLLGMLGQGDPLIRDALETIIERGDVLPPLGEDAPPDPALRLAAADPIEADPAIVLDLIERNQASVAALRRDIRTKSGSELFDFILDDIQELRRLLFDPQSHAVFLTAMQATSWLNEHLQEWLGETNAADTLTQSVPNNVTSEMGLALLDVADVIRPHPEVVAFLREVEDEDFLDSLPELEGGREAREAIAAYLDEYGMRCVGEIDITRPRWRERPAALVPVLLAHIESFEPGERERRFERGRQLAWAWEQELLDRLRALPDGEAKAAETKRMIDRTRTFIGYREYPKYGMVDRYFVYKQALLGEADRLVAAGVLGDREDSFFLTFQELHDVVRTQHVDTDRLGLIRRRKHEFRAYQALSPPRVLTSDGEAVTGAYRRDDVPGDALVGLAVSAGTVEGRARVILDMSQADLEPGDILVTTHTDPSWTPLFVAARALVTEVGGLMTHGAVIAREYGLPAVVGVERATQLITDGQQIRVNGTDGYVELVVSPAAQRPSGTG